MSQQATLQPRFRSFESFAAHYDSIRPGYPEALITDIRRYCCLTPRSRILEIGSGTGKATGLFARHGFSLTGLEPSTAMAAIARLNLAGDPGVSILEASFEDIEFPAGAFDLIFAAQSFHWVDTAAGFRKAHQLLHWAGVQGRQTDLKLALFDACFTRRQNVAEPTVLVEAAERIGLDGAVAEAVLRDDRFGDEVRRGERYWQERGIQGVPAFVFDRRHLISGAQGIDVFGNALAELAAQQVA